METRQVNNFQAYVILEPCFARQDEVYTRKRAAFVFFFVTSAAVVTPMLFYG